MAKNSTKLILFMLLFHLFDGSAQTIQNDPELSNYIRKTIIYPSQLKEEGKMDLVVVRFLITPQGKLDSIQTLSGKHQLAIEESVRLVKTFEGKLDTSYHGEFIHGNIIVLPLSFSLLPDQKNNFKNIALSTYFELGNKAFDSKQYETALFFYNRYCRYESQNKTVLYNKIMCLIALKKTEALCNEIIQLGKSKDKRAIELKKEYCP